jgi:methyl-accepting chemotaxis protein
MNSPIKRVAAILPSSLGNGSHFFLAKKWDYASLKKRLAANRWSRWRLNARVRDIRTRLPGLTEDLVAACKEVEPEFMEIGQELQEIYGDAKGLTQQVLDLVNLIGGNNQEGVFFHLRGLAESSLVQIQNCQRNVSEKTTIIESIVSRLSDLTNVCHLLEKVGFLLRLVAVNIGIESARSLASSELFCVVAQDTRDLSDKIMAIVEEGQDVLTKALASQQRLHTDFSHGLREIDQLGGNAHSIVQEAVQGIESLLKGMRHLVEQAGENSAQIQQQVGDLVMALQFHDSMSQRVVHISEAIYDVDRLLSGNALNNGGFDYEKNRPHAFCILQVQAAQLREIINEIERVHDRCVHSFGKILVGFRAFVDQLLETRSSRREDAPQGRHKGGPFTRLELSFGDLNEVIYRGRELMEGVQHSALRVSDTVKHITKCVTEMHTIGFETHLMALNAIVKAAHLGQEGGAIEVLARQVTQSSTESRSVLVRAAEMLEGITSAAHQLQGRNDDNTSSDAPFEEAMDEITMAYQRFTQTTDMVHERADEITAVIRKTKTRLEFLPHLAERFTKSLHQIEAIILELSSYATGEHNLDTVNAGEILNRYTMKKEREIHETSLYMAKVEEARKDRAQGRSGADNHGTGMIDAGLATASAAGSELFSADAVSAKDGAGDIELFDAEPGESELTADNQAESESYEMKQDKEDFGDNVELF